MKIIGEGGNGGVQFRSRRDPANGTVSGYQADLGTFDNGPVWGAIYDESRRGTMLAEPDPGLLKRLIRLDDWNELRIRCDGPRIQIWLNGMQTVNYVELDDEIPETGVIGLQIHPPSAEVWYKDIQIRELK